MACEITKGRQLPCKEGIAGIVAAYFIANNYTAPAIILYTLLKVSDIQTSLATAVTAYKYQVDSDASNFTEQVVGNRENGSYHTVQTLTLALQGIEEADFAEMENIAKARPLVVVQYRNGFARLIGATRGCDMSGDNISGGALGDRIGLNMTITAMEERFAPLLAGATKANPFAGLLTPPTVDLS